MPASRTSLKELKKFFAFYMIIASDPQRGQGYFSQTEYINTALCRVSRVSFVERKAQGSRYSHVLSAARMPLLQVLFPSAVGYTNNANGKGTRYLRSASNGQLFLFPSAFPFNGYTAVLWLLPLSSRYTKKNKSKYCYMTESSARRLLRTIRWRCDRTIPHGQRGL